MYTNRRREKVSRSGGHWYAPAGHLLYQRTGSFEAVPFDLADLRVTGPSVTIRDAARELDPQGTPFLNLSCALEGALVYISGGVCPSPGQRWTIQICGQLRSPAFRLLSNLGLDPVT